MKNLSKYFFYLFILCFVLNIQARSDSVTDLQIEGMSVGDSLLDYMTVDEIKNNELPYFPDKRNYYVVRKANDLETYDQVEIYLKSDDEKYIIRSFGAALWQNDLAECFDKSDEMVKDLAEALDLKFNSAEEKHDVYTNTIFFVSTAYIGNSIIKIGCNFVDPKDKEIHGNILDNLSLLIQTGEINKWFASGYR